MSQIPQKFALGGGLDLVSPPIASDPGRCISALNHEPTPTGYQRCDGHERYDGQPKPSNASYWILNFIAGTTLILAGQVMTGETSLATASALDDAVLTSGSYGGGDAAGYVVITNMNGDLEDAELIDISGGAVATLDGDPIEFGASSDEDDSTLRIAAIEFARSQIGALPGSGPVRGVWVYQGNVYGWRDSSDGLSGRMYAATSAGWEEMDLGRTISFTSGGTYEILEGDLITGATSAATVTISRVIVDSGDWSTGDAAGRLIIASDETGLFTAENIDVGVNLNVATIAGASEAHSLPAGGIYECLNHNFYGRTSTKRMYGVQGEGPAFEWDGAVFVPLYFLDEADRDEDKPRHIAERKEHLFVSYDGGSLINSETGNPYGRTALGGAAEIGFGDEIVALIQDYFGTLGVLGRTKTGVLYGNDANDWDLQVLTEAAGGIEWTVQRLTTPIYLDDIGLRDMRTTAAYGDFRMGSVSQLVDPLFTAKKKAGLLPTASLRCRAKDQYRLFWDDGTGIYLYLGGKFPQIMPFDLGKVVRCACSGEDETGSEIMFFGDDDGFVYQLDSGTSFDGEEVVASIRFSFYDAGSPDLNKEWDTGMLFLEAEGQATIGISAEFDFGDAEQPSLTETTAIVMAQGGLWDEINWDQFYWSNPIKGTAVFDIEGEAANVSIAVVSRNIYEKPYTLTGLRFLYVPLGLKYDG